MHKLCNTMSTVICEYCAQIKYTSSIWLNLLPAAKDHPNAHLKLRNYKRQQLHILNIQDI